MYVFLSHAAAIMCPHEPFSYYFHTPRTQMTQLRSRDTKAVHDLWTPLQLLKYVCRRTSDLEARWETCSPHPMPEDIMVYLCPVLDPANVSHRMSSGLIGLLLRVFPSIYVSIGLCCKQS
jgi:hypothetical protein